MNRLDWLQTNDLYEAEPIEGCTAELCKWKHEKTWRMRIGTPFSHEVADTKRATVAAAKRVAEKRLAKAMAKAQRDAMNFADEIAKVLWPTLPKEVFLHSFTSMAPGPPVPGIRAEVKFAKGGAK